MAPHAAVTQLDARLEPVGGRARSYYTLVQEVYDFALEGAGLSAIPDQSAKDWRTETRRVCRDQSQDLVCASGAANGFACVIGLHLLPARYCENRRER